MQLEIILNCRQMLSNVIKPYLVACRSYLDLALLLLRLGLIGFVLHNSPHLIVRCNSLYLLRLKHF
jgi:hypothetical protein